MMTLHLVPPDLLSRPNRAGYQAASISIPSTRSSRRRQCFQFLCTSQKRWGRNFHRDSARPNPRSWMDVAHASNTDPKDT